MTHLVPFSPSLSLPPSLQVVVFMPEINPSQMGGTMRLGARPTMLRGRPDGATCLAKQVYTGCKLVWERHRHR